MAAKEALKEAALPASTAAARLSFRRPLPAQPALPFPRFTMTSVHPACGPHLRVPAAWRHVEARELVVQATVPPVGCQALYHCVQYLHACCPAWYARSEVWGVGEGEEGEQRRQAVRPGIQWGGGGPPAGLLQAGPQRRALLHPLHEVADVLALWEGREAAS